MKSKLLLLCLLSSVAASLRADVVDLVSNHDTTLFQNNPTFAGGGAPGIFAGTNGGSSPRRGLISFDLSSIPAGATITSVQLTLTVGQIAGSGGSGGTNTETIGLFDVTRSWVEGTADSGTSIGGTGQGAATTGDDATWNAASNGVTPWTAPGGDHAGTASQSLTLNGAAPGLSFTWPTDTQLVADVQGWLNTPSTNDGWELINADEHDATTFDAFFSREGMSMSGVTASELPDLQVTFTPAPEPSSLALAGLAFLALCSLRPLHRRV